MAAGKGNLRQGFLCGVPKDNCMGGLKSLSHSLGGNMTRYRTHTTQREAMTCYIKWRESQGYKRFGAHDLRAPDGHVEMLGKVSHFGMRLRRGKEGNRLMPSNRTGGGIA